MNIQLIAIKNIFFFRWEELIANLNRSLNLCDLDFTDLVSEDEIDILAPITVANGIPPPPPPFNDMASAPPPPPLSNRIAPPSAPNPPLFGISLQRQSKPPETKIPIKKNKKTVKLFWKEVRDDPISHVKLKSNLIWDELVPVAVDTQKLEHLFESRAKDLITKVRSSKLMRTYSISFIQQEIIPKICLKFRKRIQFRVIK